MCLYIIGKHWGSFLSHCIRYCFVRQCIEDKEAKLYFIEGAEKPADMFTKSLGHVKFHKFRGQLGFENK